MFLAGTIASVTVSCSAQPFTSEEAALRNLRTLTRTGKLPPESVVANVESRFSGTRTGALARLLRARIKLENGDPLSAAAILNTDIFERQTGLADYGLWLRGRALVKAGRDTEAHMVFEQLTSKYPTSMRVKETRLFWAENLKSTGKYDQVLPALGDLVSSNEGRALLLMADTFEAKGNRLKTNEYLRKAYFFAAGSSAARDAEEKLLALDESLDPRNVEEIKARAELLFEKNQYREAAAAFQTYVQTSRTVISNDTHLKSIKAFSRSRQMSAAAFLLGKLGQSAPEKQEALFELARGYANTGDWNLAQSTVNRLRLAFPKSKWAPKALVEIGNIAGSKRRVSDKKFYLQTALAAYPEAIETAKAQFDLGWTEHELKNFSESSRLLTEHLARYVDKDNSNRGQAGYWAARDSERAGKLDAACSLYDASVYRYGANWYGYQALQRVASLRRQGKCQTPAKFPAGSNIPKAVANMRVVTVAAETSTAKELERARKGEELSTIGLFDWAIEELEEAKKTATNSPKINLALAKHYRLKSDNVRALLALKDSYPDYSQMFPEEMGREEWDIFYPLTHWNEIKFWARQRKLDPNNVAGLIRQETIFNPRARSRANAYGMMQLLIPTARSMARKYGSSASISGAALFEPMLNIELGTAYMREQLNKYGRIEYMSVAYNAGPGRVVSWRRTLPLQMDEFVEEIPFSETRGYVKGIIRNSAQYRRLYDISGSFKPNVGSKPIRAQIDSMSSDQFTAVNPEIEVDRIKRSEE
jgi:soluble lytic murein transglycosylase